MASFIFRDWIEWRPFHNDRPWPFFFFFFLRSIAAHDGSRNYAISFFFFSSSSFFLPRPIGNERKSDSMDDQWSWKRIQEKMFNSTAQHSTGRCVVYALSVRTIFRLHRSDRSRSIPCVPKWSRIVERCRDIVILHASSNALRSYIIIACNIIQSEKKVGRIATTAGISHRRQRQNKKKMVRQLYLVYSLRTYSLEFYE